MTQKEQVLHHLKRHGSITSWEAIMEYGITRLSAWIHELKKDGYKIESTNISKKKGQRVVTYSKYELK